MRNSILTTSMLLLCLTFSGTFAQNNSIKVQKKKTYDYTLIAKGNLRNKDLVIGSLLLVGLPQYDSTVTQLSKKFPFVGSVIHVSKKSLDITFREMLEWEDYYLKYFTVKELPGKFAAITMEYTKKN